MGRETEAEHEKRTAEAKRRKMEERIYDAMDRVEFEGTKDAVIELEQAVDAAQKAGMLSKLRVQARNLLASRAQDNRRVNQLEDQLHRLTRQLSDVHNLQHAWIHQEDGHLALADAEEHH